MANNNSLEIQLAGEKQVELWLSGNGYSKIEKKVTQSKEVFIKANGLRENILIKVTTFLHPHRPFKLSEFEKDKLTRRASKHNLIPYTAYVILDDKYDLAEEIVWERL